MRYTLLIFDWDGTVIDSAARIVASMQSAAQDLNWPVPDDAAIRNIIGLGLREALTALFPTSTPGERETLVAAYREYFMERCPVPSPLFPDVEPTLAQLRQAGFELVIATGKGRQGLNRALQETGLTDYFTASRCADETSSKPSPHMVHELLAHTGHSARRALVIGDTEYDMQMARAAGTAALAVSYGVHSKNRLLRHAPIACIDTFPEIIQHVTPSVSPHKDES